MLTRATHDFISWKFKEVGYSVMFSKKVKSLVGLSKKYIFGFLKYRDNNFSLI